MKTALLLKLAVLLVTIATLAGCLLVPVDDGYYDGDHHDRGRGGDRGERHDRR